MLGVLRVVHITTKFRTSSGKLVVFERFVNRNWEETSTTSAKELIAECFEKNFEEGVLWNNPIYINRMESVPVQSPSPEQHVAKPKPQRRTLLSRKLHTHTHT